MTGYTDLFKQQIPDLRISGVEAHGRCPFHEDRRPSFSVNLASGLWKCHDVRCRSSGNAKQFAERLGVPFEENQTPTRSEIAATYDYTAEDGGLLFQVVRTRPKGFYQRRPDGNGGWVNALGDVARVLYRLPEVVAAVSRGERVYVTEGEKDAESLRAQGLIGTTPPMGAGKWREEYAAILKGARVAIIPDNDEQGRLHAEAVARSLSAVAREIKVLLLDDLPPKGDVSDWLARGHKIEELKKFAEEAATWSPEAPALTREGDAYRYSWAVPAVTVSIARIREDSEGIDGEVAITVDGRHVHWGKLNLASTSGREGLVKKLDHSAQGPDWRPLLEYVCRETAAQHRAGEPVKVLAPILRENRYLIERFLPAAQTTILFGDGDAGKSLLALATAIAVSHETDLPCGLHPNRTGNVLFIDYEADEDEHNDRLYRLCRGFGIEYVGGIFYRRMTRPLADDAMTISTIITKMGIDYVILDSYGPACEKEPEGAEAAFRLFNALRSFKTTALIVAHVSKAAADQRTGPTRPYGSVFARNLARAAWELRRSEDEGLSVILMHNKSNRGDRFAPIGLRFEVRGDAIVLRHEEVDEHPDLLARTSVPLQITTHLRRGAMTNRELIEATGADEDNVKKALQRLTKRGKVVRLDEKRDGQHLWGLTT